MPKIIFVVTILLALGGLSAQTISGKLFSIPGNSKKFVQSNDTLKILAVMASFQEDRDDATFGNGKFGSIYTQDYGLSILDPLPHNKNYFEAHLRFVKNYFTKVSNGKLNISYNVLPDTFSVSKTMRNYSPPENSNDFTLLGDFSKEVWTKASQLYPNFNFKDYDIFLVFHAGVGKDITLPGSIGSEKDLPSVYLGPDALKKIYGQDFSGFPVSEGNFNITNSMIIPETESRELSSLNGNVLFEITINGLLVSSIASYLGLPDLFDTETGKSAIGRFGLMDGQAIFAYNGLFPPQPSAWEKIYLGWVAPVTVDPGNFNVKIAADLAALAGDTTILKVPINSTEYYLLENRERDVQKNGAVLKCVLGGDTLIKVFEKDTTGFYSFQTDSVDGVVVDVDEFDWAVPGNGIVIWHIDDNIINSKIVENKINADKQNRGVEVVEADGIKDIGEEFQTIFGDVVIGEGEPQDFWYRSNNAKFYKNKFGSDTKPSSTTNSGANSLITISDFSDYANTMGCKVSYGDSLIKPLFAKVLDLTYLNNHLTKIQNGSFALLHDSALSIINTSGTIETTFLNFSKFKPASVNYNNTDYLVGASGRNLNIYSGPQDQINSINISEEITAPPVILNSGNEPRILIGTTTGKILTYSLSSSPEKLDSTSVDQNLIIRKIAAANDYIYYFGETFEAPVANSSGSEFLYSNKNNIPIFSASDINDFALTKNNDGKYTAVILVGGNKFFIVPENGSSLTFQINPSENINSFALSDLRQDGENYILFTNGNKIEARNLKGVPADNFPFPDPLGIGFTGTPLAADFVGNNNSEIIASTGDGRVFALDGGTGKVVNGFPISAGNKFSTVPLLFENNEKISLAGLNSQNYFYAWNIGASSGNIFWGEENGNSYNSSFVESAADISRINIFFPKERAYNYPNPVYGGETNFHYYVSEDSKINIKIFDLAGDFVAELNDDAKGGLDNETVWKVDNIQSGVYIARIEAAGTSGKVETNIIKIAVIK